MPKTSPKLASYTPDYLTTEVTQSMAQRQKINEAFAARVKDAIGMMCRQVPSETILFKHGRVVTEAAEFSWKVYWDGVHTDSEGKAYRN